MTPAQWLAQSKFIRWAFLDNTWVLAHAFLGICLANGFYLAGYLLGIKALSFRPVVLVCTFVAAIVWTGEREKTKEEDVV